MQTYSWAVRIPEGLSILFLFIHIYESSHRVARTHTQTPCHPSPTGNPAYPSTSQLLRTGNGCHSLALLLPAPPLSPLLPIPPLTFSPPFLSSSPNPIFPHPGKAILQRTLAPRYFQDKGLLFLSLFFSSFWIRFGSPPSFPPFSVIKTVSGGEKQSGVSQGKEGLHSSLSHS